MSDSERGKTMSDSGPDSASPKAVSIPEREALRAALAKATPGEWEHSRFELESMTGDVSSGDVIVVDYAGFSHPLLTKAQHRANARAIALAVNLAPALLEAVDGAEAEVARLTGEHADAIECARMADTEANALRTERDAARDELAAVIRGKMAMEERFGNGAETLTTTLERAERERDGWIESARHFANGQDFYRGLLHECAAVLGDEVRRQDDGGMIPEGEVLALKVPPLVIAMASDLTALRARLASAESTALESSARLVAAGEQAIRDGAEIARLRAAAAGLDRYVQHLPQCDIETNTKIDKCSCGLDAALGGTP